MSIDAMKQALEALEWNLPVIEDYADHEQLGRQYRAITALRAAIEQAQEPRQWKGLTADEIESISADNEYWDHHTSTDFARAVEALLKAKNS